MATRTKSRKTFDLSVQLPLAWKWCWENRWNNRPYVTATDLETRLRSAAAEVQEGAEYGSYQNHNWGLGVRLQGLNGRSLLEVCRSWLFTQVRTGKLRVDNSRGNTSTGARFRPIGVDLSEAEKKTRTAPKRPKHITSIACKKCLKSDHSLAVVALELREIEVESTYGWGEADYQMAHDRAEEAGKVKAAEWLRGAIEARRHAIATHADFPQYSGHWDSWVPVRILRRIETKMGVAFEQGDITIGFFRWVEAEKKYGWVAYSVRNGIDTKVEEGDIETL